MVLARQQTGVVRVGLIEAESKSACTEVCVPPESAESA
jgi:hypothetical protein